MMSTVSSLSANPLLKGRHQPDFSKGYTFSLDDETVLKRRGLSDTQRSQVSSLYEKARSSVASGQGKSFLASLDSQSLELLQKASSLAGPIHVGSLSEEGAENLLLKPTEGVDLNNDGMIEQGAAKTSSFPPLDASPALRSAWEKTVSGMGAGDTMTLSLMLGGPMVSVSDGSLKGKDFSGSFDWNSYMKDALASNEMSKASNSPAQYEKIKGQLEAFWSALKSEGLA